MLVLALETSGAMGGVAVIDASGPLAHLVVRHRLDLSQRLAELVRDTLLLAGCGIDDIEGIAVSQGPGSFTGLRIGVTMAKSLAFALQAPVVGVGTLEAMAAGCLVAEGTQVYAVQEASATELFVGCYSHSSGACGCVSEDRFVTADQWLREAGSLPPGLVLGVLGRHRERLTAALTPSFTVAPRDEAPSAVTVGLLGREALLRGEASPEHSLAPRYLRVSTPEARLQTGASR